MRRLAFAAVALFFMIAGRPVVALAQDLPAYDAEPLCIGLALKSGAYSATAYGDCMNEMQALANEAALLWQRAKADLKGHCRIAAQISGQGHATLARCLKSHINLGKPLIRAVVPGKQ